MLWDGEGRAERARPLFASLARSGGERSLSALWWLGWDAYRAGRYDVAEKHLGKLMARERSFDRKLRARYWHARAAERGGRETAQPAFAALARDYPLSYYGWRAGQRATDVEDAASTDAVARGATTFAARELARPRILLEAGRIDAAREELGRLYARADSLADRLVLADLYANAGDFHRAQRIIAGRYSSTLARAPRAESIELWWHAWPAPFRGLRRRRDAGTSGARAFAGVRDHAGRERVPSEGALGRRCVRSDAVDAGYRDAGCRRGTRSTPSRSTISSNPR